MIHKFQRLAKPPKRSFFLFGARQTGKSTLLRQWFPEGKAYTVDLLDPGEEDAFNRRPGLLEERLAALPTKPTWVILDEIQRAPRLLDVVHRLTEKTGQKFAMTGSSARKLRRGGANLLAGRAEVHGLYPLTHLELGKDFSLTSALEWGTLPRVCTLSDQEEKREFLKAYALTYLKEEIAAEQLIRNLTPFRSFLEVAAQCNGTILNYARIAREVGVDTKTAQTYFTLLEDTLIGFFLPAFHESVRKQQNQSPKFFFFDTGVKRALEHSLEGRLTPGTYGFGNAFEHFIILELVRLAEYRRRDWKFSYLRTNHGLEIDCIIDRPGQVRVLLEIKSAERVDETELSRLSSIAASFSAPVLVICVSRESRPRRVGKVLCLPWERLFQELDLIG